MSYVSFYENMAFNRFDYGLKFEYARQYTKGRVSKYIENKYLRHIRIWNSFIEDSKQNKDDFINTFNHLLDSCKCDKNLKLPPISISTEGNLVNGIHRLVATKLHGLTLDANQVRSPYLYNQDFFERYTNPRDNSRFGHELLLEMKRQQLKHLEGNLFFVLPGAIEKDGGKFAHKYLRDNLGYSFKERIRVPNRLIDLLTLHFYYDQNWIRRQNSIDWGAIEFKSREIRAKNSIQYIDCYLIRSDEQSTVKCKREIREYYKINNGSAHSTDTYEQAWIAFGLLTSLKEVAKIWRDRSRMSYVFNALWQEMLKPDFKPQSFYDSAVSGSSILDIMGLRQSNDLDNVHRSTSIKSNSSNTHNHYDYLFDQEIDSLIDNPDYHFSLLGRKFLNKQIISKFKEARSEHKDLNDLTLIENEYLNQ